MHDRGSAPGWIGVLGDLAVCIADGGRVLSDRATLRDQPELYGPVASDPIAWRTLEAIGVQQRQATAQIPDPHRRDLLITCDGAGATLELIRHITTLNNVHGRRAHYSVGFDLGHRARTAIGLVDESDWN